MHTILKTRYSDFAKHLDPFNRSIVAEFFDLRIESSSLNGGLSIAGSTVDAVDSTLTGAESIDQAAYSTNGPHILFMLF